MLDREFAEELRLSKKIKRDHSKDSGTHANEQSDNSEVWRPKKQKNSSFWPASTATVFSSQECYVHGLASSCTSSRLAAALSNGRISIYETHGADLRLRCSQKDHEGSVQSVVFNPQSEEHLFSCGLDGLVLGWDLRSGKQTHRFQSDNATFFTLDVSETRPHLAAGAQKGVTIWDLRISGENGQLVELKDTHKGEVSKVAFHPSKSGRFLSGSTDGLISVFNFSASLEEDECFEGALNLMDSVASFGFYGTEKQLLWCRTQTEAFYLWDWAAGCSEAQEGGEGPMATVTDAREKLSHRTSRPVTYLLDAVCDDVSGTLSVVAGDDDGHVAVVPVKMSATGCKFGKSTIALSGSHNAVVRCHTWPQQGQYKVITGGEDGQIVGWTSAKPAAPASRAKQQSIAPLPLQQGRKCTNTAQQFSTGKGKGKGRPQHQQKSRYQQHS